MTVQRFEDLKVWQEVRVLVSSVYEAARNNAQLTKDYRFRDQITAAAVSVNPSVFLSSLSFWVPRRSASPASPRHQLNLRRKLNNPMNATKPNKPNGTR